MKTFAILGLCAGVAFTLPVVEQSRTFTTPSGFKIHNLGHQGDGFYQVKPTKEGEGVVVFTPISAMNATGLAETKAKMARRQLDVRDESSTSHLTKRDGITCGANNGNWQDNDAANVQLAYNVDSKWYGEHSWGWVYHGSAVAFSCPYQGMYLYYSNIIDADIAVSNACGGSGAYGFRRTTNQGSVTDLSAGRASAGDEFCASGFRG